MGVGVAVDAGVAVGVEGAMGVGVGVGVEVAVGGCRWHWQRKKAAKTSTAVLGPAKSGASRVTIFLTEQLPGFVSRRRFGFASREIGWFSSGVDIGIWSLPRAEKPIGKVRSLGGGRRNMVLGVPEGCPVATTEGLKN